MNSRPRLRSARRIASLLVMVVLGALVFIGGPSGTSTKPADAAVSTGIIGGFCPDFLKAEEPPPPFQYRSGVEAMMPSMTPAGRVATNIMDSSGKAYGKQKVTAYENFGSNGLKWSRYDTGCGSALTGGMQNLVANQLFGFSTAFTSITIGMYTWATDPNLLDDFMKPVGCVVKGCAGSQGLDDALYLNFLTPVIVMGALWAGWTGLVKKSTTQAWQGGLWMLGAATFALFFMANPTGIADAGNSLVSNANAITASAVTSATSSATAKDDVCYLPEGVKDYGPRTSSCSIWKALAYTPWSTGQFGVSDGYKIKDTKNQGKCTFSGKAWNDQRLTQLCSQSQTHDEAAKQGALSSKKDREDAADSKGKLWKNIAEQQGEGSAWAGTDAGFRVNIAFASIIANLAAGLIIVLISFSNVVLALGMVLLILGAPVFLLIGAHPGVGRGIALKWLELLIGTVVKRMILGFFLALLIGMYQIIIATDMAWMSKVALIMAVGVAGMIYRKPMMEALNVVNLGGTQTGIESGHEAALQKGGGMATGAVGGGIGAALAGGGAGAILGSMAGGASRGGSNALVQAGRAGQAQGAQRGAKSAADRAARKNGSPAVPGGNGKVCPTCGGNIPAGTSKCPTCGGGTPGGGGGGTPRPNGGGGATPTPSAPVVPTTPGPAAAVPPSASPTGGTASTQPSPRPSTPTPAPAAGAGTLPTRPGAHDPGGLDLAHETAKAVVDGMRRTEGGGNTQPPPTPAR